MSKDTRYPKERKTCPECRTILHFRVICGIRIVREIAGRNVLDAHCPKCARDMCFDLGKADA